MTAEEYRPPFFLFNRHLETIFPSLVRDVTLPRYRRERIATPDDDFLDLDWLEAGSSRLVILSHGLEGNTSRPYMLGMARAFNQQGFDVLAWNYRGCSEEMNRQLRFYHSGATDDLGVIVNHAVARHYTDIFLIGFSLGGNVTLKYLGEESTALDPAVKGGIAFSVPVDLHTSCIEISKSHNWIYAQRFLRNLKEKIRMKAKTNPALSAEGLDDIDSLIAFDNRYTAPLHGFKDAIDYYTRCSSRHFLEGIARPTLLISSRNDPFLSPACFPVTTNSFVTCEYTSYGGHVGFTLFNQNGLYWSELRALQFIKSLIDG